MYYNNNYLIIKRGACAVDDIIDIKWYYTKRVGHIYVNDETGDPVIMTPTLLRPKAKCSVLQLFYKKCILYIMYGPIGG